MNQDLTVVILAAGLGTRMKSRKAKVLHEAGGMSLVEHVVESALAVTSAERIAVVVGHQAELVERQLSARRVRFVRQAEQLGTGHAVMACAGAVKSDAGRLVVLYGDCPLLAVTTLEKLLAHHERAGAAATVITAMLEDPTGYGRAVVDDQGYVQGIVEHKVATAEQRAIRQVNSGIYCFEAGLLWSHLSEIKPNAVSKEYYLTDIVEILHGAGHRVSALLHENAGELLGINTRVELADADRILRERKTRELMLEGVTVRKPETVTVDTRVRVGMDTVIEAGVHLLGATTIGTDCVIGAGCVLKDARIGDGVIISPYTVIESSVVEARVTLGPFARLRPGNQVDEDAHIGNFVELKKTHLGAGAKAGHLAYLGDSDIGAETNIGAGTITCNYDGKLKHKTTIGEGAFVGSNSTLVAPVAIGDGSYVGAGSVVTDEVPGDALALGRARQVVKNGWAKARRDAAR